MPKSKNKRNNRFSKSKIYRKPAVKKHNNIVAVKSDDCSDINYSSLLKKQLVKDDYSIHKVAQLQKLALADALLKFNQEPLVVPCQAEFKYFGPEKKPELVYHTRYQDVKKAIMDKLREFNLYFGFTSIDSVLDEHSGLKQVQVTMDLCHGLGGKTTVTSKPVLVVSCNIDGEQLTIDKCVHTATTKAKKDVLTSSLLNVLVDMPECYTGKLVEFTDDQWNRITPIQIKALNKVFKSLKDRMNFLKYLKENYNARGIRHIRGFQYDNVLFDMENWEPIARAS